MLRRRRLRRIRQRLRRPHLLESRQRCRATLRLRLIQEQVRRRLKAHRRQRVHPQTREILTLRLRPLEKGRLLREQHLHRPRDLQMLQQQVLQQQIRRQRRLRILRIQKRRQRQKRLRQIQLHRLRRRLQSSPRSDLEDKRLDLFDQALIKKSIENSLVLSGD